MLRTIVPALLALAASLVAQIETSAYTSTFASASATRGFYFQTPVPLVIVGLRVPDERANGTQNVEVFRMTSAPPAYPATGSGTQVFYAINQPSKDIIPCTLVFQPGEFVGILGACGTTTMNNSYGAGAFATNVLGQPITLYRFLTQTNINTSGGDKPYSSEGNASIARIEVYVAGHTARIDYGAGTGAGSISAPTLTSTTRPVVGTNGVLSLNNAAATNQGGVILLSFGRASIPILNGTLLINPPILLDFPLGPSLPVGATTLTIPIPNNSILAGSPPLNFQGFVLQAPDVAMTNGTEWWIGY